MQELSHEVTMKGNPVKLFGYDVQPGESAPNCVLTANDLSDFELASLKGSIVIISVVPSLDTPVCDIQTKQFNEVAISLGDQLKVITISMDLPFAQSRWCGLTGSESIITLSDYKDASFGQAYGVLIKDLRLLTRAVFIVDAEGILQYKQIVPEITNEPDYEDVLQALNKMIEIQ